MSSPPLSNLEPSIQSARSGNPSRHFMYSQQEDQDEEENGSNNLKYSLAHYFSTIFVVFIGLLLISIIVLFIWSNMSDGAWVSLQVTPVLPNTDYYKHYTYFPIIFSFLSINSNLKSSTKQAISQSQIFNKNHEYDKINTLSSLLSNTNNLNLFTHSLENILSNHRQNDTFYSNNMYTSSNNLNTNIADLSLNMNIC